MNIGDEVIYNGRIATVSTVEDSKEQVFNILLNFGNENWKWVSKDLLGN